MIHPGALADLKLKDGLAICAFMAILPLLKRLIGSGRTANLKTQADTLGLNYVERGGPGLPSAHLREFRLFGATARPVGGITDQLMNRWENRFEGAVGGHKAVVFDYYRGIGRHEQAYTVAAFTLGKSLPAFELGPPSFFQSFFAADDGRVPLEFYGRSPFSELYSVRAADESARGIFDSDLLGLLEAQSDWHVECSGKHLIVYRSRSFTGSGGLVSSEDFQQFLRDAGAIAEMFARQASLPHPASAARRADPVPEPLEDALSLDALPSNGICPKCGGPVAEVSSSLGVCKKCGAELVSIESRSRKRWGLVIFLLAAAIYGLYVFFGPHHRP
ncbi:MAG: hypothetical protein ACHQ49_05580 [Elusimicrobiota bacterium]